jgi:hypothetical protein
LKIIEFRIKKIAKIQTGIQRLITQMAKAPPMMFSELYYGKTTFVKLLRESSPFGSKFIF